MTSTTEWLQPLQSILNRPIRIVTFPLAVWNDLSIEASAQYSAPAEGQRLERDETIRFVVQVHPDVIDALEVQQADLNETEKELISWTIRLYASKVSKKKSVSETESAALKISEWLLAQLRAEEPVFSLPDHLTNGGRLFAEMIPFLLITEYSNTKQTSFAELEKLLTSFLGEDILLIPMDTCEWLIWGPSSLLKDADSELKEEMEETVEDTLASICSGLHDMLTSEWIGDCHLAVSYPVVPAKGMVETAILLRETINLGRKFQVGSNIHLPWMLNLERILNSIPENMRVRFLEQALKRTDLFLEAEMLTTLETFFALDCNVSETAKKLYIHRNTLLYRLDKLKNETGLDVRLFRDAVLVKIILLLYKVTKSI
ncbi:PucR family transcriptional regulator [Paenibacillus protaetiae]|uniref:PucR family transcriptional regulator n=1 Tax=Paenibacillus protaetiae TaxID=2509456 RepID=A0A4P6EYK7_9BACL|nr:helix-turn-helix domain-containing protein [Paenibacillus protaetiae]QAY67343.1 PucR family transcriptional regulator [Paenibacillus protaetiae]